VSVVYLILLFFAKLVDNMLGTSKVIFMQKDKATLAGIALAISTFISLALTKSIVSDSGMLSIGIVALSSGLGCYLTIKICDKVSKERTYVNVIMSSNREDVKELTDFLRKNKITNVVTDSYDMDWNKSLAITAYAETKAQSKLIDEYINTHEAKYKRFVQNERVRKEVEY